MQIKRNIQITVSGVVLAALLCCFAFSFNSAVSGSGVVYSGEESQVATFSDPVINDLLSNSPVSVPAPSITNLNGGSAGNGFSSKLFYHVSLCDTRSDVSFFNFYLKETTPCKLSSAQLHVTFCVFRI